MSYIKINYTTKLPERAATTGITGGINTGSRPSSASTTSRISRRIPTSPRAKSRSPRAERDYHEEQDSTAYERLNNRLANKLANTLASKDKKSAKMLFSDRFFPGSFIKEPNMNNKFSVLVHYILLKDEKNVQNWLQKNEEEANLPDNNGFFPLHWAIRVNKLDIVQTLLENGADPSQKDNEGRNALHHWAVEENNTHTMDIGNLLLTKLKPNHQDHSGYTPLAWAIKKNNAKKAQFLLDQEADPCVQSTWERTALHEAVYQSYEMVEKVLNSLDTAGKKKILTIQDSDSHTALRNAMLNVKKPKDLDIAYLLLKTAAKIQISENPEFRQQLKRKFFNCIKNYPHKQKLRDLLFQILKICIPQGARGKKHKIERKIERAKVFLTR